MEKITDIFVNVVLNNLKQKSNMELCIMESQGKEILKSIYSEDFNIVDEARALSLINPEKRIDVILYLSTQYENNTEIADYYNNMIDVAVKKYGINTST